MKKQLGQFFTKQSDYILQGFEEYVKGKNVIDPFAGNRDLMAWSEKNGCKSIKGFDVDKNYTDNKHVFLNDSINNPLRYKFICTNPPYLHKNKADIKTKNQFFSGKNAIFEDLYQVSIISMLNSDEGIIIVPLNFLSAENSHKTRNLFFEKFQIVKLNIFSEQVFEDTTYNVVAFYYKKRKTIAEKDVINATVFPEKKKINFTVEKKYDWQLGGEFVKKINFIQNYLGIFRLTESFLIPGDQKVEIAIQNIKDKKTISINQDVKDILEKNILVLRAIDSKNGKKIQLEDIRKYQILGLAGKVSSRNMAHLIFKTNLSSEQQKKLLTEFNEELNINREKYFSYFLTNFRDNNRKRISFDFTYKLLNYIYQKNYEKQPSLF
jgi:hypothetical protein